jgi:hypothetical protein
MFKHEKALRHDHPGHLPDARRDDSTRDTSIVIEIQENFAEVACALGGTRTPNLLIRSQMLYPLSYKRWVSRQKPVNLITLS